MDRRLRRALTVFTPTRWAAAAFLLILMVVAVFGPLFVGSPVQQDIAGRMQPVGTAGHVLGTDELGRDVLARIVHGARAELLVSIGATAVAATLGTALGLVGGFLRGWAEFLSMRILSDVLLAFPPLILALLAVAIYGPGAWTLIAVMGTLFMPTFARVVYGQTLSVTEAEYVKAAEAFGARAPVRLFSVVLPNVLAPIIVQCSIVMAAAILLESGLSYLGLGIVPPQPSWGAMVAAGQRYMATDPAAILVPSLAVVLTILAFGILGDTLRDALDPRGRTRS